MCTRFKLFFPSIVVFSHIERAHDCDEDASLTHSVSLGISNRITYYGARRRDTETSSRDDSNSLCLNSDKSTCTWRPSALLIQAFFNISCVISIRSFVLKKKNIYIYSPKQFNSHSASRQINLVVYTNKCGYFS